MALKIRWTARAVLELDDIIEYLEKNWTRKQLSEFFTELEKARESIRNFPERNKNSLRKPGLRAYQLRPEVTLFYIFDDEYATIMLLWPNRKDPNSM